MGKLTARDVSDMKRLFLRGASMKEIAARYGVHYNTVSRHVNLKAGEQARKYARDYAREHRPSRKKDIPE